MRMRNYFNLPLSLTSPTRNFAFDPKSKKSTTISKAFGSVYVRSQPREPPAKSNLTRSERIDLVTLRLCFLRKTPSLVANITHNQRTKWLRVVVEHATRDRL